MVFYSSGTKMALKRLKDMRSFGTKFLFLFLQTRALKSSITKISDAHLQLSQKMNLIFSTTKEIVQSLDDMPSHLRTNKAGEEEGMSMFTRGSFFMVPYVNY